MFILNIVTGLWWVSVAARGIFIAAFGVLSCSVWDLVPWSGFEPRPPALGSWSLSPWTTRKVSAFLLGRIYIVSENQHTPCVSSVPEVTKKWKVSSQQTARQINKHTHEKLTVDFILEANITFSTDDWQKPWEMNRAIARFTKGLKPEPVTSLISAAPEYWLPVSVYPCSSCCLLPLG